MKIDWLTLIAQVINFLVLVWLLKHFLYGRIIQAMDEREAKIASRVQEAVEMRKLGEREAEEYRRKKHQLDQRRESIMSEVRQEADSQRQEMIQQARTEVDQLKNHWIAAIKDEQQVLAQELRRKGGERIFSIVRKVLKDLSSRDLQRHLLGVFLDQVLHLDDSKKQGLLQAIQATNGRMDLKTTFPLAEEDHSRCVEIIQTTLGLPVTLHVTTSADALPGVELRAQSQRLIWSAESYLDELEEKYLRTLEELTPVAAVSVGEVANA